MATVKGKNKTLSRRERLDATIAGLQSRYPGRVIRGADYTAAWNLKRIPTGILNLDIATNGGLPCGGMSMIVGAENVGKNWLLNQCIRRQQEIYGDECAFAIIGTEMGFDKGHAQRCGVKVALSPREIMTEQSRFKKLYKRDMTDEEVDGLRQQVGEFIIVPPETAENSFQICAELVDSGDFNIVAIDSFGSILTSEESDKTLEDVQRVAGPAGLNTRLMRKLNAAFAPDEDGNPNLTCLIGTNQLRANLHAQHFQKKTHEGGGWAIKHGRFVTIELTRIGWLRDSKKKKLGRITKWDITKQKAGGHDGQDGTFDLLYGPPMLPARASMAVQLAAEHGIVEKGGNWYSYDGTRIGNGLAKAAKFVEGHNLVEELEDEVLRASGVAYLL